MYNAKYFSGGESAQSLRCEFAQQAQDQGREFSESLSATSLSESQALYPSNSLVDGEERTTKLRSAYLGNPSTLV
jgi:hypothetical protein